MFTACGSDQLSPDLFLDFRPIIPIVSPEHTGRDKEKEIDMEDSPYSRFESDDLILRDELAVDRTLLANERTLLSYLRAGISLLIAGVSIMHFSYQGWFWAIGLACIPIGIVTTVIGVSRYRKMNRAISLVRKQANRVKMNNNHIDKKETET